MAQYAHAKISMHDWPTFLFYTAPPHCSSKLFLFTVLRHTAPPHCSTILLYTRLFSTTPSSGRQCSTTIFHHTAHTHPALHDTILHHMHGLPPHYPPPQGLPVQFILYSLLHAKRLIVWYYRHTELQFLNFSVLMKKFQGFTSSLDLRFA